MTALQRLVNLLCWNRSARSRNYAIKAGLAFLRWSVLKLIVCPLP
jgi:hypothetical protein